MSGPDSLKEYVNTMYDTVSYYTASLSPHLQGVEIRQPFQLSSYTNLKIRGNISFGVTLDGVLQQQNFFNELLSSENLGTAGTGSQVSMDTPGRLGVQVVHETETRDLGMSTLFNNSDPFEECDSFWNPITIISSHLLNLVVPTSLVQICSSPSSFDGVIEPLDIRRVVDRSSIEMPYIAHSIKGSLSIVGVNRESELADDKKDLRNSGTRPFLDSTETFGGIDQPGAFSDAIRSMVPHNDTGDCEEFYQSGTLDAELRTVLLQGFDSGSVTYFASRPNCIRTTEVFATRGFDFSQNDNYRYDSITFGGLLK